MPGAKAALILLIQKACQYLLLNPFRISRLLRFQPGVFTTAPFVHDYWEEVYLLQGDLTVGNDEEGRGGESFAPGTYACRPPGAVHGPFKSEAGCLLLEI